MQQYIVRISRYPWWIVILELLLIGVVVHSVIEFMRGTRGARMLQGIVLLLVVLYLIVRLVGASLNLERIQLLYTQFLVLASFAVVVVFLATSFVPAKKYRRTLNGSQSRAPESAL